MENRFRIKEINAEERVTFQNKVHSRDVRKETKRVDRDNRTKLKV